MKTIHEVRVPFTCIFRRWYEKGAPRNVKADEPICIVERLVPPYYTTDIEAGADGWLEVEEWIKLGTRLDIGTIIARVHKKIQI